MNHAAQARERRVARRLEARGCKGLGEALVRLRGSRIAERWELGTLFAVGAEGAVFLCRDLTTSGRTLRVAKIALLPYHKPFEMSFGEVRRRRDLLRAEARRLESSASPYMPEFLGSFEFANPLLDSGRGGEFALPEPVFVMERLPGFDLDCWLARVHASSVPRAILRRNVDHVAIVVLRGLWDLHERGFFYCDLRPGNVRIRGRSQHRVRLMDAGSLVPRDDPSSGFPHVPAYLPPELFLRAEEEGADVLVPSLSVQAVMAGRTLFEVATGRVPMPGMPVDVELLRSHTVSPEIADTIEGLCAGAFDDVFEALNFLATRTAKKSANESSRKTPAPAPRTPPAALPPAPSPAQIDLAGALAAARANFTPPPAPPPKVARPAAAPAEPAVQSVAAAIAATSGSQRGTSSSSAARPAPAPEPEVPVVRPMARKEAILPASRAKPEPAWSRLLRAVQFWR